MDRRTFIGAALALVCSPAIHLKSKSRDYGWLPGPVKGPSYYSVAFKGAQGSGTGKRATMYKAFECVTGRPWAAHGQWGGDCVAQATGSVVDLLTCTRIAAGSGERWQAKSSTDLIYSGGRNLIAPKPPKGNGMVGWWAVDYVKQHGVLLRQKYLTTERSFDLQPSTEATLEYWKDRIAPKDLLWFAQQHPVTAYASISDANEMRDAIVAGHPVVYCARMGAENNRLDKEGFLKPSGTWYHAWTAAAVDDNPRRPGVCLINSHGPRFGNGPRHLGNPPGSCWVDFKYIDKHLGEAYALTDYRGFKQRGYNLWWR